MPPPDLENAVERAAYRRELHGVARGVRLSGLWLAAAGVLAVAAWRAGMAVPLWLAASTTGIGAMLMITAIAARSRYHALRRRG